MKSLWGGSRGGSRGETSRGDAPRGEDRQEGNPNLESARASTLGEQCDPAPSERTRLLPPNREHDRLLPNRVVSTRYLSPDDPAVSPYNLWSVRATRYITILFTLITFVWWVILLISAFVTIPGFHTRGSGFLSFSYASLALANLLFTLVFFAVPAKAVRIASLIIAVLLLIDAIILISVQQTRHEEGWVGIVSVLWALFMSIWTLATDRLVEWGKYSEEERLTGRAATRRTLYEWLAVLISTISMIILAIAVFLLTCTLILRAVDASLGPPGKRYWVDANKYQMHVYCHGNEAGASAVQVPTVLFEGGEGPVEDGLWAFAENAIKNGSIDRYCFVDRPGIAWSDTAPSPLSAGMAVEAIDEALARAGEQGPWVLASAGIGSIYSRILSSRHGEDIKGLLLIDPMHELYLDKVGNPGRGFILWLRGIISPLGLDRVPGALFKGRTKQDRVWGRSAYQTGKFIFAKLQENLVADSLTRRDIDSSRTIQERDVPLTVISSGEQISQDSKWKSRQRDLTRLTNKLQSWDIVQGAPHEIWRTLEGRELIEQRLKELVRGKNGKQKELTS
ncbi:mitochondrial integral membrane protein [Xylaria sp. CBS 124048]|nr:mitochondrial integral membrane protein [Xylaria sp. CBS 124048]